jgi:CubicO group peptidase (beta-lactamase class C family)
MWPRTRSVLAPRGGHEPTHRPVAHRLDGVRLLSPQTVELMTSNHVGSLHDEGRTGFGLGFEITEHVGRSGRHGSVDEFGWGLVYPATLGLAH